MSEKIVVTGGAGFIGSNLIRRLNQMGEDRILVVDSLGTGPKWKNLNGLSFLDYRQKNDFIETVRAEGLPAGLEALIHLGACSSTTEQDLEYLIKNNYEYSKILAEACRARGIRFIYASSAATYGNGAQGYRDNEAELDDLRPLNGYGFSKHIFDLWARRQGILERAVGLKYFNVFGPQEDHKGSMRSLVAKGFEQVRRTGRLRLFASDRPDYADGDQERDFLYVKDAVEMTIFFLPGLPGERAVGIHNAGSGQASTWNSLAAALFSALGRQPEIEYIPLPQELRGKYQYHTLAEMEKLRKAGYDRPPTPLAEAVSDYVKNHLLEKAAAEAPGGEEK